MGKISAAFLVGAALLSGCYTCPKYMDLSQCETHKEQQRAADRQALMIWSQTYPAYQQQWQAAQPRHSTTRCRNEFGSVVCETSE